MKKKLFLLTVALLCTVVQGAWADTWDGVSYNQPRQTWLHGLDLELCIGIESAAELAYICEHFNETVTIGDHEFKLNEANYLLSTNIDMGTHKSWNSIGNHGDFIPTTYTGSFHGDGHTITIHTSGATANYQGLFARIGNNAMVENLYLAGNIQCSKSRLVGGIAGENYGTIENCWVSADVSSDWQNSFSAYTAKVGGIAGENHGTVKFCCMTGNVTNDDKDVGGIVGYNNGGTIDNCTFYGTRYSKSTQDNIWVGDQKGTLTNQHSGDDLLDDTAWNAYLKDLVDFSWCWVYHKAVTWPYFITIAEGSTALTTDQTKARPGLTITLTPASGTNPKHIVVRNADGNPVAEWYAPIASTLSFTMPQRNVTVIAYDNATWAGSGTEEDPYLISTAGEWDQICTQVSQAAGDDAVFIGTYFKQTADFTIKQGIGEGNSKAFGGVYDGDGHTLTCDISVTGEAAAPFHQVSGATISNLHVTGAISGGIHTAGLVAICSGSSRTSIDNCRMSATITCTGNDTNDAHGGGFIGHAGESEYAVTGCLFDGKLIAETNSKGNPHIGAIVGWGGGGTRIIHTTIEKGTFEGANKSQMAFCWKDNVTYAPSTSGGNYYFSDLGHSDGAEQLVSVASGTEGLEITYDYTWKDVYHGAMTKATSGTHTYFTIGDTFYTTSGGSASFRLAYPTDWNVTGIYSNGTEITGYEGLYTISNITASTSITAAYSIMQVELILNDANSNEEALENYLGRKVNTLTLSGRTLYKDGKWNTLCLPFDMNGFSGTPLAGATVKTLESSNYDSTTKTLTLNFSDATSLKAGKSYLVKWASGEHLVNPIFQNVNVSAIQAGTVSTTYVDLCGSFSPVTLTANNRSVLYLGADNTLYYPSADKTVNSCRAVFRLKGIEAGDLPQQARRFVLNFGDGETATGIIGIGSTRTDTDKNDGYWYDLQGRKLSGKSTQKGIYINHGNKVVIK